MKNLKFNLSDLKVDRFVSNSSSQNELDLPRSFEPELCTEIRICKRTEVPICPRTRPPICVVPTMQTGCCGSTLPIHCENTRPAICPPLTSPRAGCTRPPGCPIESRQRFCP